MQTFLPHANFCYSAKSLDYRRLGKQRVEAMQIANIISGKAKHKAWRNHPAVRMWQGYLNGLIQYAVEICDEWTARGYNDTCKEKILSLKTDEVVVYPPWIGDERVHGSHRSKLMQKDYKYYSQHQWRDPLDLEYYWPV